jgi:uncharacterized membrane protein
MSSLRHRIVITWAIFVVMALALWFDVGQPLLVAACALTVSIVRRFQKPHFPRAPIWFERTVYVLIVPTLFFLVMGFLFGFVEPWLTSFHIGTWIIVPILLVLTAHQDFKAWHTEKAKKSSLPNNGAASEKC